MPLLAALNVHEIYKKYFPFCFIVLINAAHGIFLVFVIFIFVLHIHSILQFENFWFEQIVSTTCLTSADEQSNHD